MSGTSAGVNNEGNELRKENVLDSTLDLKLS